VSADEIFKWLVLATLPVAVAYPLVYGSFAKWWRSDIGQALLIKAVGLAMLLMFSALFYTLGPDYVGRDTFRIVGMCLLFVGLHRAFWVMCRELRRGRRLP
jgi:hypothetical protein